MTLSLGPVALAEYETICMRILFALVVYKSAILKVVPYVAQPRPVGLAHFADLTFLSRPRIYQPLRWLAYLALVLYCLGLALPIVLPYLLFLTVATFSLRNSQGAVVHAKQMIAVILLVQSALYVTRFLEDAAGLRLLRQGGFSDDQIAAYWSQQAIIAVYFTAALSKLWKSRFLWVRDVARVPLQMVKTTEQRFHNELDPVHTKRSLRNAAVMLRHPQLTRVFMSGGLMFELLAPLVLLNRQTMVIGGLALFGFHRLNTLIMNLHFRESQRLIFIYFVNLPFLAVSTFGALIP